MVAVAVAADAATAIAAAAAAAAAVGLLSTMAAIQIKTVEILLRMQAS
jgi:hypothetical protein